MRDYAKTLYSLDQNVGRILDYLKESGLDKNTTVIYTSLHGVFTGQHGWFSNGFMYEESMKTPLLIRFSSGTARKKTEIRQMVQNIDFAPTILDLLDMDIPSDMQGKSFLSAFRDSDAGDTSEKTLYYHYYRSEECRVGKECTPWCRSRWSTCH